MKWIKEINEDLRVPIKSWCSEIEEGALQQAKDVAVLPVTFNHVALMPDCHVGYGMPVCGVIACENAVIPYAVGVDIGCGMIAVETDVSADLFSDMKTRRELMEELKAVIPLGEGRSNKNPQDWDGFERYKD